MKDECPFCARRSEIQPCPYHAEGNLQCCSFCGAEYPVAHPIFGCSGALICENCICGYLHNATQESNPSTEKEQVGCSFCDGKIETKVFQQGNIGICLRCLQEGHDQRTRPGKHCSFCKKSFADVDVLIQAPGANICNECVEHLLSSKGSGTGQINMCSFCLEHYDCQRIENTSGAICATCLESCLGMIAEAANPH
jgi:hypothetical protein